MSGEADLQTKFEALAPFMGELLRRMWAATEAQLFCRGGVAAVHRTTGIAKSTILRGIADLESGRATELSKAGRVPALGAGRKVAELHQDGLADALYLLIAAQSVATRNRRCVGLRRVRRSSRPNFAGWFRGRRGHGRPDAARRGYSLQSTRKRLEGTSHVDRNEQFEHISALTKSAKRPRGAIISEDTKKKELVGPFSNAGRKWQPSRQPEAVNVHDFPVPDEGKATPYSIYDVGRNEGFVRWF